jgi:hypothetical protein
VKGEAYAKVRVIKPIHRMEAEAEAPKLRVCAYCRVSSDHTGQLQSFSAQVEYYTRLIENNDAWTFAGIYADEASAALPRTSGMISKAHC